MILNVESLNWKKDKDVAISQFGSTDIHYFLFSKSELN